MVSSKLGVLCVFLVLVPLFGCTQTQLTCNKPYIRAGAECCLDQNDNNVCDKDEPVTTTGIELRNITIASKGPCYNKAQYYVCIANGGDIVFTDVESESSAAVERVIKEEELTSSAYGAKCKLLQIDSDRGEPLYDVITFRLNRKIQNERNYGYIYSQEGTRVGTIESEYPNANYGCTIKKDCSLSCRLIVHG